MVLSLESLLMAILMGNNNQVKFKIINSNNRTKMVLLLVKELVNQLILGVLVVYLVTKYQMVAKVILLLLLLLALTDSILYRSLKILMAFLPSWFS
jgi:hypothetical protein